MRIPMKRSLLAAALSGSLLLGATTITEADNPVPAQQTQTVATTTATPPPKPPCSYKRSTYRWYVRHAFRYSSSGGNYVAFPVRKHYVHRATEIRHCAKILGQPHAYHAMLHSWNVRKRSWHFYAYIDSITPYGEWAIPSYIVMCESGGVYSKWNLGGSGASGAYQIMSGTWARWGGNRWASAAAYAPPYAQHIVARRIWFGQGAAAWSCS